MLGSSQADGTRCRCRNAHDVTRACRLVLRLNQCRTIWTKRTSGSRDIVCIQLWLAQNR